MEIYKRVLASLDGSKLAVSVLTHIEKLATALEANISVIRVAYSHSFPSRYPIEGEVAVVEKAEEYARIAEKQPKTRDPSVDSHVRYGSDAEEEILAHNDRYDIDLNAMCTHGRTGVKHLPLGNVAEEVIHHRKMPVLLMRAR